MTDTFHKFIRKSIADQDLQIALDANAERRIEAREAAFVSLSGDLTEYRQHAKKVRQDVIANLDQYLDEFTQRVESNGIKVHFAADAQEAVRIVHEIATASQCRLIAKSKTMVSEEIGLNHALEDAGFRVVETDLGEYIIQLRGEPPAHIITPAVHLRKEQVGETFSEKLDVPYTEDIARMTSVARQQLRRTFLEADIGISGVNFGVIESGSLCLLTNEGNGRMVTTLPKIHIALMGIERLVPTMDDLALMLELLPRSATGQKMTVYTTLINSPRREGELDGAQQRHVILVDNGRRAMKESPLEEGLLCIRCGACLNACPVFAEIGGHAFVNEKGETSTYPGPIGSIVSPGLFGQQQFGRFARASSLCGACKDACPVDIDLPKLLLRVRAGGVTLNSKQQEKVIPSQVDIAIKLYSWMATNPKRFTAGLKLAGNLSKLVSLQSGWLRLPGFTGWGYSKDLPSPSSKPFRARWGERQVVENKTRIIQDDQEDVVIQENQPPGQSPEVVNLIQRFSHELISLGGEFTLCESGELGKIISERLKQLGVKSILSWDEDELPVDVIKDLKSNGIDIIYEPDPDVMAGLSGAELAIADTGTVIVPLEKGKPHFVSLLPEYHIVILRADDIVENIYQALSNPNLKQVSMTTLISGPSRTADIEMTLTIGVHGPKLVSVFCIEV